MENKEVINSNGNKNSLIFSNSLIWFGAGISIAEIIAGTSLAPLGFYKGTLAVIIGHIIGCALLFAAGVIGAKTHKSSMETTKYSFGILGSKFFALLNVVQLVGWTGIMIFDGAQAANEIFNFGPVFWCVAISLLIILWIFIGIKNITKLNVVVMICLFVLTIVLSVVVFSSGLDSLNIVTSEGLSFAAAMELPIAMPLSWLPLVSDYTKDSDKPVKVSAAASISYCFASIWMYVIGLAAAIFAQNNDIAQIMLKAGLGIAGMIIIVLSTVTTTFLDAYSAGVSSKTVFSKADERWTGIAVTVIACAGAVFFDLYNITNFLYCIGSVFAPMIAILIADFFVIKSDSSAQKLDLPKILIWLLGFVLYRISMKFDFFIGNTIPVMFVCVAVTVVVGLIKKRSKLSL